MNKKGIQKRIEKLKRLINHHRYLYHVLDRQEISEAVLDSLKKELFDLEQKFPEFVTSDSPTQRVEGKPLEKFKKTYHPKPMLSFNDAFSEKDIKDWEIRISKLLTNEEKEKIDFFCELKIDGLAVELIYENEVFKVGSTRGDGLIGEDVTHNLKTIEAIPLRLRAPHHFSKEEIRLIGQKKWEKNRRGLVARGEVFIPKKEFEKINKEQEKKNLTTFANPRNMAAGSIRQLDPKITSQRHLDSFAYELLTPARHASQGEAGGDFGQNTEGPLPFSEKGWAYGARTHEEKHEILKALGFKTNPHNRYCENLKEVFEFHQYWQKNREKIPYEIDGIVVIINDNMIFEKLGVVGKAPRGAIAFKFPLKQATTEILDIKVQVGRTGSLTPVAVLKPVEVGGVTISRATLHNEDEIKRLGVKIGDTVIVGRAGDVIPDIIGVFPELRTGKEREFRVPKKCPVCAAIVEKLEGEVISRCPNPECSAKKRRHFYHFISRGAFDIVGLGPKIIDKLIEEGIISDPADLFNIKQSDILQLERFAEKSTENLLKAVQEKKKISLPKFIYSLGIRNVGEETARHLAGQFYSLENLKEAGLEELQKIIDVGPVVANSIYKWFSKKKNIYFLEKLKKSGVEIVEEKKTGHQPLKGETFVLTGTLETMAREKAKERIRILGGEISESISKKTNFVISGKEPGSKYERAKKLGVRIINEKEFLAMLK